MKLGPYWRRKYSALQDLLRKVGVYLDFGFWLTFDSTRFKKIKTGKIDKVLISLVYGEGKGNVGGNFCLLGVVNYFKELHPKVEISFLVDKTTLKQFGIIPGINMIEYKRDSIEKLKSQGFKAIIFVKSEYHKIKDFKFIPYSVTFIPTTFGPLFHPKNFDRKLGFTRKVLAPWQKVHMVEYYFKMFEALGFKFRDYKLKFYHDSREVKKVDDFLRRRKIKKFIVLHPWGKYMVRTLKKGKVPPFLWSLDRYAKVADYFSKKGYRVLITGSSDEKDLTDKIDKLSENGIVNCCGVFNIRENGVLYKKAGLLVATDNGMLHVAYQTGVPIVELIGPSPIEHIGAWPLDSEKHSFVVDEGPCFRIHRKKECPEDIPCLDGIKVGEVIGAAERLLEKNVNRV